MSKVKLTIQNTPLHNYRENGCKRSAQGSLGSFGLTSIDRQYSKAANNQLSFVYVFSIQTIPENFAPNVPYLFAVILHFIYSREYGHVTSGRGDFLGSARQGKAKQPSTDHE